MLYAPNTTLEASVKKTLEEAAKTTSRVCVLLVVMPAGNSNMSCKAAYATAALGSGKMTLCWMGVLLLLMRLNGGWLWLGCDGQDSVRGAGCSSCPCSSIRKRSNGGDMASLDVLQLAKWRYTTMKSSSRSSPPDSGATCSQHIRHDNLDRVILASTDYTSSFDVQNLLLA